MGVAKNLFSMIRVQRKENSDCGWVGVFPGFSFDYLPPWIELSKIILKGLQSQSHSDKDH